MKKAVSKQGEALMGLQSDNQYGHEMLFDANGHLKKALFIAKGVAYVPVKDGDIFLRVSRKSFCDSKGGRGPCRIEIKCLATVALDGKENFKLRDRSPISLDIIPPHTWYGLGREKVDVSYLVARDNRFFLPKEAEKGKRLGKTISCTTKLCGVDSEIYRDGDICKFCLLCSGSGVDGWFCVGGVTNPAQNFHSSAQKNSCFLFRKLFYSIFTSYQYFFKLSLAFFKSSK